MIEVFPFEKIRIIASSSKQQLMDIEIMKKNGEISEHEAIEYQRLVLEVFLTQKESFCA
ncbi:MAG: hypothetical protein PHE78_05070 [Candidatus Gastranaerophilales bacterium]|jgi:hypothetical protein|nr:hypothetical protein [Candidatus Gastranaerophilales bacterium]